MTYSIDFRKKVLQTRKKENLSIIKTSKRFGISGFTIMSWLTHLYPKKNKNKPCPKINMEALKEDIKQYPDAYQYERAKRFNVTIMGICHALKRLKVTYKKNSGTHQEEGRKQTILPEESQRI